ncbi:MAG: NAD-dependent epimerase/dehydratase family protein [Desulfamplus sp.]|nr:NAD-dependent epimerase/dehydratase family protein [Desulfamplus sp.]
MKIALVTGGTGKIGQVLVPELLKQKFRVRLFLRDKTTNLDSIISSLFTSSTPISLSTQTTISQMLHQNIEIFFGDITDYKSVSNAVLGVDYIFHLAAILHINNPHPSMYGQYYDVNVIGTKNIVDAALIAGVQRVILFSTISVYGVNSKDCSDSPSFLDSNKQIFYESSPVNPLTIYAKTKLLAEQYSYPCVTILRLASVYGSGVTGNYLRLIMAVRKGFFCIPVNSKGCSVNRTLIHEKDVVTGAILAATHPEAAGKIYNLTDGAIHSLEDIVRAVANAISVDVKIFKIPEKPLKIFSNIVCKYKHENIEKVASIINKLMENIAVDGKKIQVELGFQPKYNLKNGWYEVLEEDRKKLKYLR